MATNSKRAKIVEQKGTITSKYDFMWAINNFYTGCKNVGDVLTSPIFATMSDSGNIQWQLILYPKGKGKEEEDKEYLAVYLKVINIPETVKVVATFKLLNTEGEVLLTRTMSEYLFSPLTSRGYRKFIFRKSITENILNDNLSIVCEIIPSDVIKEKKNDELISEQKENKEPVLVLQAIKETNKYIKLINDSKFSDVSLISSEGKVLKAHKCILAKSSSVFEAMFDVEMKEKHENKVKIEDIKYEVLLEMICFIYAGKVKNIDTNPGELAAAADKYALDGLKYICEETMYRNLNIDNVVESLKVADRYRMTKLKKEAIEFIVAHIDDVKDQTEFLSLPSNIMHDLWCVTAKNLKKELL